MEKTKTCRHGLKRLLAFLLSTLCLLGLLPMSAFAMEPGQTASSWLGDQYVGSVSMWVLTGSITTRPRPTPTWSTIPMGPWMYAPALEAVLTATIC